MSTDNLSTMSFRDDCQLLSLIKKQANEEAKSVIKNENLYNALDTSNNTLLHYAAKYRNPEIVQFLIDSGSEVDTENELKETPLVKSLKSDLPCVKVIEILLRAGANVEVKDSGNKSALDIVDSMDWLNEDCRRVEILKVFIEQPIEQTNSYFNVLTNKDLVQQLLETNVNLHKANEDGDTLVHLLARNDNPCVIELLHGRNYDVNVREPGGRTPLMTAACWEAAKATKFLLNEGADIEAQDRCNRTALYLVTEAGETYEGTKKTVEILLEYGANTQVVTTNGQTVFDEFSRYDDYEIPELVIAHLALQEALGTAITDLILSKINAQKRFTVYLKTCRQELSIEIYPSVTLFNLLRVCERKLERYLRNEQLASKTIYFKTKIKYFNRILRKRIPKAKYMIKLRKDAVPIVCRLTKLSYDSYPFVVDEIVAYLDQEDIKNLMLIQSES